MSTREGLTIAEGFQKPPTAQQAVLAELRSRIVSGRLRPGQQVIQEAFASEFDVSRVPLREALKILQGEGLIIYQAHRGYYVAKLSVSDLREVYHLRELLEGDALREAMPNVDAAMIEQLILLHGEIQATAQAGDVVTMMVKNRRFHFTLFEASRKQRLVWIIRLLWDSTDMYRSVYYNEPGNRSLVLDEHWDAIEAVRNCDVERLISVMAQHRENAVNRLVTVLDESGPADDEVTTGGDGTRPGSPGSGWAIGRR